jgi:cation:H+ antiporter
LNEWVQLAGGALLLYFGAEWFVAGASALALALRVPQLLVGLTVVAYGTSAPEIIVGIRAAATGHGELALGNVIGSNVTNIGLILGLTALVHPAWVDGGLRRRELPVLLATTALVPLLLLDGEVSRFEGGALVLTSLVYTVWMVRAARELHVAEAVRWRRRWRMPTRQAPPPGRLAAGSRSGRCRPDRALVGGSLFVTGAVSVAQLLGLSDHIVGLTIVAISTSLPELVTSRARRGHSGIAVGNVVGSNIFNVLLCLGSAALVGAVGSPLVTLRRELWALILMTALAAVMLRTERRLTRLEGGVALVSFAIFLGLTVWPG